MGAEGARLGLISYGRLHSIGSRLGLMRAVFFLAIWELLKVIWGPVEAVFG